MSSSWCCASTHVFMSFPRFRVIGLVALLLMSWAVAPARAESVSCQACDFNHDGAVDQQDFALFQACFTGRNRAQNNPGCAFAMLDIDADVDSDDLLLFASCVSGPAVPIRPGRLLISELMASNQATIRDPDDPSANKYPDWIELYNDDSEAKDLGGLYLSDDPALPTKFQIPAGVRIEGGQRLLFWADSDPGEGPTHTSFKLSKDGQSVVLTAADGHTTIDSITYGPLGADVSMGALPDASDNWRLFQSPDAIPTPGEPNSAAFGGPKVIMTEIMYHPYSAALQPEPLALEWLEIYNAGQLTVDLTGWRFTRGITFQFADGTNSLPGEYLVVASDVTAFRAMYPSVTNLVGGWTGRLSNDAETLELVDAAGRVIDSIQYADGGDWAGRQRGVLDCGHYGWDWYSPADGGGPSLELMNLALSNDYGHNWAPSTVIGGTPGAPNSVNSSNIAPIIDNIDQTPIVPHSTDSVTITAHIIDELKTGLTVKVYYRTDGATSFTAANMADDGAHGDGAAGDGVYGGQLPTQPNGTIIEYYVEATDGGGNVRRMPPFALPTNQPLANRLYQVDDTFTATLPAGSLPQYYILMTNAERLELVDIGDSNTDGISEQNSDAQMNGTFISLDSEGVKARYTVGVRNRGHGTRIGPPNNYRVDFVNDHSWNNLTQLDINAWYPWLQFLGGKIFEAAGLPAQDMQTIHLRVDGTDLAAVDGTKVLRRMYGEYVRLESTNGDFAKNHFPNDGNGNVYRCVTDSHNAILDYRGTNPANYRDDYSKQSHGSEEDWSDLIHLCDVLSNTPDATYEQVVPLVINVDQWVRWFAIEALIGNNETNLGNGVGDDYYLYRGVLDPRFVLIPHDFDTILGTGNGTGSKPTDSIWLAANVPNVKRFLQHPAFCHLYYRQIRDLMQTVFSPAQFNPMIDSLLAGTPAASEATAFKNFEAARLAYVPTQIPAALTIQSDLPVVAGNKYSTQNLAALYGQGNAYDTRSVRVNGLDATWDPVVGTWKIGATGGTVTTTTLISKQSTWRYLDNGTNQGTAWKETNFNDSTWKGPQAARLGYGGDGETSPALSFGPDANNKYITYYFRRAFAVGDTSKFTGLKLRLLRDDGAVVYINGTKVVLPASVSNMPDVVDWKTLASTTVGGTDEQTFFEASISPSLLTSNASNEMAVEVHQSAANSSDIGFDMELVAESATVTTGVPLTPGLNHVLVQEFDGPNGTGNEIERGTIDIFYDDGVHNVVSGTLSSDKTLDMTFSPWHVTSNLTVPAGVTLTIQPGVTVLFEPGTLLTVNGKLVAQGTDAAHIVLTRPPAATGTWSGVAFNNTLQASVMSYVDQNYGDAQGHSIGVTYSRLLIDHMTWSGVSTTLVEVEHPSLVIQNSMIPGVGDHELLHGEYITGSEYFVVQGNTLGVPTGYNDVIDFSGCKRPGPIFQVYNNVFTGASDDCLDLDGCDTHAEGNVFMHVHKNNTTLSTSNAIATGVWANTNQSTDVTAVRNVFIDCDHAMLLKEASSGRFENNTVINCTIAAINFDEPERQVAPGAGATLEGNIFWGNPLTLQNVTANPNLQLTVNHSLLPAGENHYGVGNIDANPLFVNAPADLHLQPGSPAIGTGPYGLDMGAYVPSGASIFGAPNGITNQTSATLTVWGPGVVQYQYRVRDDGVWGSWSADIALGTPLVLTGLLNGHSYAVEVIGRNSAGVLEDESDSAISPAWVVDTTP